MRSDGDRGMTWAYIAGFFDGEGTIRVLHTPSRYGAVPANTDMTALCNGRTPGCDDAACGIRFGMCHCGCGRVVANATQTRRKPTRIITGQPNRYLRGHGHGRCHGLASLRWEIGQATSNSVVIYELETFLVERGLHPFVQVFTTKGQDFHRLLLCRREEVLYVLERLLPHLRVKRARAEEAIATTGTRAVRKEEFWPSLS